MEVLPPEDDPLRDDDQCTTNPSINADDIFLLIEIDSRNPGFLDLGTLTLMI